MTSVSRGSISHHKNRFCTFQRLLFNHMGDGALPRSDPNLSAPEKGKRRRPSSCAHGGPRCPHLLQPRVSVWTAYLAHLLF